MVNLLIIAIVGTIVGLAVGHILKSKKRGVKCIGCPEGCSCTTGNCSGCTSCGSDQT